MAEADESKKATVGTTGEDSIYTSNEQQQSSSSSDKISLLPPSPPKENTGSDRSPQSSLLVSENHSQSPMQPNESVSPTEVILDVPPTSSQSMLPSKNVATKPSQEEDFTVGLFSIGVPQDCLLSWFCSPCALAIARQRLDNSWICFNLMFVNTFTTRFLVRSAYDIPGSIYNDFAISCCCVPCVTNQIYQTVKAKGRVEPNRMFVRTALDADCNQNFTLDQFLASLCCFPCIAAMATTNAIKGIPLPVALCCMTPCTNANIIRYHYGDISDEWSCLDDCVGYTAMYPIALLMCLLPCYWRFYGKCIVDIGQNPLTQVDRGSSDKAYLHPI